MQAKSIKQRLGAGRVQREQDNREKPPVAENGFYPDFWKCARELTVGNHFLLSSGGMRVWQSGSSRYCEREEFLPGMQGILK